MLQLYCEETVVCSVEWRSNDVLTDPGTSIMVQIIDNNGVVKLAWTNMTKDAVGKYHYDYAIPATFLLETYKVKFRAIDAGRTTIVQDNFEVRP